mgnify:CR=1 FL=1
MNCNHVLLVQNFASWCWKEIPTTKNIWGLIQICRKFQRSKDILHSTDFVDIGGKPLIKKSVREESSFLNGLTDQWTDDILGYYKEIYTGLSQMNRSEYGRNSSGIATSTTNIVYPPNVPEKNIDYNERINQLDIDDDVDFEWI